MYTSLKYKWKIVVDKTNQKEDNYDNADAKMRELMKKIRSGPLYSINHICKLD